MTTCSWCAHPEEPVTKKRGLCSRCNSLALKRVRLEKSTGDDRDFELKVCDAQIQLAKDEAARFEPARPDGDLGMELETALGEISKGLLGKDIFERQATVLENQFSAEAAVQVIDVLNRILRQRHRRTLYMQAQNKVVSD